MLGATRWFPNGPVPASQKGVCTKIGIFRVINFDQISVWGLGRGPSYAILLHNVRLTNFGLKIVSILEVPFREDLVRRSGRFG